MFPIIIRIIYFNASPRTFITWFKSQKLHLVPRFGTAYLELLEPVCFFEFNSQDHLSCNPICYLMLCQSYLHGLILKWIYSIVPINIETFILTARRDRTPSQIFKMVGNFALWERFKLLGSLILQVPATTTFDEFPALIINSSLFSCSTVLHFPF